MYLAELELHGFKSFAQKTNVKFGNGITAIVGPNGCGKSNIVDALRWALGEQRPSLLRSNAMTNVIFNGTATKKPLGLAEVSVTIHNNRGILPTEFDDITITRRLYRSGDSEYLLNRVPCRLKDITEMFMDTGMGSNAYSVIELKMVEEILADKNNDRRKLFEEAAGVTKYKEKRKQTMKKLDETRTDMLRIEDILVEIRKKVKSLQIQAGRAQRAKQYEEDLVRLDKAISRFDYDKIQSELGPLLERLLAAEKEKEELNRQFEQFEQQQLLGKDTLSARENDFAHAMRQVSRFTEQLRDTETTIKISSERISAEENVIRQYESDVSLSEIEIRELKKAVSKSEEDLKQAESALADMKSRLDQAQESLDMAREEVSGFRSESERLSEAYRDANTALSTAQNKKVRTESRIEGNQDELLRLNRQIESLQNEEDTFNEEQNKIRFEIEQARDAFEIAEARHAEAEKEREHLRVHVEELKDKLRSYQSKREALQNEVSLLQSLSKSDDALPFPVKHLKQFAAQFDRFELVADLFSTSEALSVALEAVLGDAVNFIVVDTIADAKKAFDILKSDKKGKTTVVPLELLNKTSSEPIDGSLYFEVKCAPKYEALKKLLLGNVRLFESIDQALEQTLPHSGFVGVTAAGELIHHGGIIRSGSAQKNEGLRVGLQDRIKKLESQLEQTDLHIDDFKGQLDAAQQKRNQLPVESLLQKMKDADRYLRTTENRQNSFNARKQVYERNLNDVQDRKKRLLEAKATLQEELESIEPELIRLQEQLELVLDKQHRLRSDQQKSEDALNRMQSRFSEAQLSYQQAQNRVDNSNKDIERSRVGIAGIMKRLEHRAESAKRSKDLILSLKKEIESKQAELDRLKRDKVDADEALNEAEERVQIQRGRLNQLEEEIKTNRRKREVGQELLHQLEMTRNRFDLQVKSLSDHVWETYGLLMDQVTEPMPEDIDPSAVKEQISVLKERLKNIGEVNKLAISEYDEEKVRLDTFESQMNDLNAAEDQLRQTISEINHTANERFSDTFDAIRTNFQNVFHTLFQETDHCDLILEDNAEDPLDRRINIIANPRGKRPSNIEQLSGGEKTLTAIALLFAIYLVKPSPFCILDEVDAPLDDANVERFTSMIKKFSKSTQFIIITHNKKTMERSEMLYGVTMPEVGVSKLVAVRMEDQD
jgi:chromosome segregation protein